jgi:hypothetical protein
MSETIGEPPAEPDGAPEGWVEGEQMPGPEPDEEAKRLAAEHADEFPPGYDDPSRAER